MEKITFKYEDTETGDEITMKFDAEDYSIFDLADKFKQFCLAMSYYPESLEQVFKIYEV